MVEYDYHKTLQQLADRLNDVRRYAMDEQERRFDDPVIATRQAAACLHFVAQAMGIRDLGDNGDLMNEVLNAVPRRFIVTESIKASGPGSCKHAHLCKFYEPTGETDAQSSKP